MLNSAVFGGAEARDALQKGMFDDELDIDTNWCVGGTDCKDYRETEDGIERADKLRACMDKIEKEKQCNTQPHS